MAISNAQAVRFSNEGIRPLAETLINAYYHAKQVVQSYYADPSLGEAYTAGISEIVADGSEVDGRPVVTGNDALGLITQAANWVSTCEANGNAVLNVLLGCAVNVRR